MYNIRGTKIRGGKNEKNFKIIRYFCNFYAFVLSCGSKQEAPATTESKRSRKVAIVFSTGGLGDKSFNDSANAGLKKL